MSPRHSRGLGSYHMGGSENEGYLILGSFIIRILLFNMSSPGVKKRGLETFTVCGLMV